MEYKVITEEHTVDLEKKVRELISIGFVPQGGIAVTLDTGGMTYATKKFYQAMVREK
jgi:hypothetical protein